MGKDNEKEKGGFVVHVYSPGNMFAENITFEAPVYFGGQGCDLAGQNGYSDEQIARAIEAINGKNKPLNSKRKWAAVHWCLRWYCNCPKSANDFCERVKVLPLGELEYECDYNSIRHFCTLSFMDEDARHMDKVKASKNDQDFFLQCREVVVALVTELGKTALPKPKY